MCTCPPGFGGALCDEPLAVCDDITACDNNGGVCVSDDNGWHCSCPVGVGGDFCEDLCPDDPAKTAPGVCGCGVADTDSNANGITDCVDPCSPNPCLDGATCTVVQGAPVCGCGVCGRSPSYANPSMLFWRYHEEL